MARAVYLYLFDHIFSDSVVTGDMVKSVLTEEEVEKIFNILAEYRHQYKIAENFFEDTGDTEEFYRVDTWLEEQMEPYELKFSRKFSIDVNIR